MAPRLPSPIGPYTGCWLMTTRTACLIMGWLEMIVLIPAMFAGLACLGIAIVGADFGCSSYVSTRMTDGVTTYEERGSAGCYRGESSFRGTMAAAGVGTLALGGLYTIGPFLLLIGANKGKAPYLIPYFVVCVLKMFVSFIAFIVLACMPPRFPCVFMFLTLGIETFKAFVIYCHHKYLTQNPTYGHVSSELTPTSATAPANASTLEFGKPSFA